MQLHVRTKQLHLKIRSKHLQNTTFYTSRILFEFETWVWKKGSFNIGIANFKFHLGRGYFGRQK